MELETLRDLYIDELRDLYSAEKQIVAALPKMARSATNSELRRAFEEHLEQTRGHVDRLEVIFETLDGEPGGKKCKGMEGLIEEGKELMEEDAQDDVLDAGLIAKAQHVEHYEMAGYGTVRTYALILGENKHAQLLQQTLDEEIEADRLLTELAESAVNIDATIGDEASEEQRVRRGSRRERDVTRSPALDRPLPGERAAPTRRRSSEESSKESRDG
jgi:ferritin-like metal-binding protein YciE